MNTKELIKKTLQPLISQIGGVDKVAKLPEDTLLTAIAHTDDVIAVTLDDWVLEIPDMDLDVGYEVYNRDYDLLYNEGTDLGLTHAAWGTTERDIYLLWVLGYGEYVYLTYQTRSGALQRTLLLIRF